MAAAYLYHVVLTPPFLDGNKRTGLAAAIVFLALNGVVVDVPQDGIASMVEEVARGNMAKPQVAQFLRRHSPSP